MAMGLRMVGGRPYYYRNRRVGGRFVSEYLGAGLAAELAVLEAGEARAERAAVKGRILEDLDHERSIVDYFREVDRRLADALHSAGGLASLEMLEHRPRRRRRVGELVHPGPGVERVPVGLARRLEPGPADALHGIGRLGADAPAIGQADAEPMGLQGGQGDGVQCLPILDPPEPE
jgi:hypothetical protein